MRSGFRSTALALLLVLAACPARALEWITIAPNPAYTRDLAMGASTVALAWAPQSQSINPAGLSLFQPPDHPRGSIILNPAALWQLESYRRTGATNRASGEQLLDGLRLLTTGVVGQVRVLTAAAMLSQPVMFTDSSARYRDYRDATPLDQHQNSLQLALNLHPRVAVGARVDRYYRYDVPEGEGFSYGVILRPRGVRVGVQYQRYPASGARVWHPLDRRVDESTTAGVAVIRDNLALSVQINNLTQSGKRGFLEPHAGFEWRPSRFVALRAGGTQFSRSRRWAWTAGLGLLDSNWLRHRSHRLRLPDDFLQLAVGVIYDRRVPVQAISSLTCAWRF